jgi:hypothetical protein
MYVCIYTHTHVLIRTYIHAYIHTYDGTVAGMREHASVHTRVPAGVCVLHSSLPPFLPSSLPPSLPCRPHSQQLARRRSVAKPWTPAAHFSLGTGHSSERVLPVLVLRPVIFFVLQDIISIYSRACTKLHALPPRARDTHLSRVLTSAPSEAFEGTMKDSSHFFSAPNYLPQILEFQCPVLFNVYRRCIEDV